MPRVPRFLKDARPEKFPLISAPTPFIFDHLEDNILADLFCELGYGQDKDIIHGLALNKPDALVAIHPLSTPIDIDDVPDNLASKRNNSSVEDSSDSEQDFKRFVPNSRTRMRETLQEFIQSGLFIEQPQSSKLPLPSPSASPVQSGCVDDDRVDEFGLPNQVNKAQELLESMPKNTRSALIYKMLQQTDRTVLSTLVNHISRMLQFDLLSNLPTELSTKVLSFLDFKSLVNVGKTCKNWCALLSKNGNVWQNLIKRDNLLINQDKLKTEDFQALAEKYHTIDKSLYSDSRDEVSQLCFKPNFFRLLYKKQYLINKNWSSLSFKPKTISFKAHEKDLITCLQFDEEKIVSGANDNVLNVFSTKTGKKLMLLEGHEGEVWGMKYIGNTLVSAATDKTLRVWSLKTGKCTHVLRGHNATVRCMDIIEPVVVGYDLRGEPIVSPKKPILVSGSRDSTLNMWDLSMVKDDPVLNEKYGILYTDREISAYQKDIEEMKGEPKELTVSSEYFIRCLRGHSDPVRAVAVYGNLIVSGSYDTDVRVWDAETGKCKLVLREHTGKVYAIAIDKTRNTIISGSMDNTVNIWDIETGTRLKTLTAHTSLVGLIQVSPKNLVTAAADGSVRIWDPEDAEQKYKLLSPSGAITCLENNDNRVIFGSVTLHLGDIKTGKKIKELISDSTFVWQVKFNDKSCVAAVRKNEEAWIEILDFES